MKPPHIIIINPDQWRGDTLGHVGHAAVHTPVLDRLVKEEAVSFRSAFCQNPVCTPSRCSFMTGWYPHVRGHRTMHHMLHPEQGEKNLLQILKEQGYFVWWGGKNDLLPGQDGFEQHCEVKFEPTGLVESMWQMDLQDKWRGQPGSAGYYSFYAGRLPWSEGTSWYHDGDWANILGAVNFLQHYQGEQPLCIYLPLTYPHPPYAVEEPWFSQVDRSQLPPRIPTPEDWDAKPSILKGIWQNQNLQNWTEEQWNELRAVYYGMCARLDHQVDLLLEALKQANLYDDAAIFFFSDHGDFTGDYGLVEKTQNTFEDCLTRVPMIIKPPRGVTVAPGVREALVELVDFPATVFDLTGIQPGYTHFGHSLLPLLADPTLPGRDAVFCEGGRLLEEMHCSERDSNPILDPHNLYWPRLAEQRSEGPEHSKAAMCRTQRYKYVKRLYEQDELYDLQNDPQELHNLQGDPAYAGVLSQLKERLLTWYQETSDVVPWQADHR